MAEQSTNPTEGLLAFANGIKSWIGGGIAFITALVGFTQLVRSDTMLTVLTTLACVVVGLWLCTIYVFVKMEPLETKGSRRTRSKRRSSPPGTGSAQQDATGKLAAVPRRHAYSDRVRHRILSGSSSVSLLAVVGLVGWSWLHPTKRGPSIVPRPIVPTVLVATFANYADPSPHPRDSDAVTQFVFDHLSKATAKDAPNVQVLKLGQSVDNSTGARAQGRQRGATIVLWGWYAKSSQRVTVKATFDVLAPLRYLQLRQSTESVDTGVEELQNFRVQNQLGAGMSYLTLLTLGLARYEAGAYKSAITLFDDAHAETMPAGMVGADCLYFYCGIAHFFLGDYRAALSDFNGAVAVGSVHAATYYNRGVVRRILGDWKGALDDYSQAIRLDHTDAYALYNRGLLLARLGHVAAAITDYSGAIHYDPGYANAYLSRGNARLRQGDTKGAIADYSRVIHLDPRSATAYGSRATAYYDLGQQAQAIADYRRAISIKPAQTGFYYGLGNAYFAGRDDKDAIAAYTHAIHFAPRETYLYYSRGYTYERMRDWKHADADYSKVIRLNPIGTYAYYAYLGRATVRAALGDPKGASADRRQAQGLAKKAAQR